MAIKSEAKLTTFEAISMIVGNSIGTYRNIKGYQLFFRKGTSCFNYRLLWKRKNNIASLFKLFGATGYRYYPCKR